MVSTLWRSLVSLLFSIAYYGKISHDIRDNQAYLKGRGYPFLPQLQSIGSAKLQELRISSGKMQIESRASELLIPNYLNCYHRAFVRIPKVFYEGRRRMPMYEIKRKSQTLPGRLHGRPSPSPPRYCAGILHRGQFSAVRILSL